MKHKLLLLLAVAGAITACAPDKPREEDPYDIGLHSYPGGKNGTTRYVGSQAYGQSIGGLTDEEARLFDHGDKIFEQTFVPEGPVFYGLGPLYNNTSCSACHPREGRAKFPANLNDISGFFLRTSIGNDPITGPIATPQFSGQLQQMAVRGHAKEVQFAVRYEEQKEVFPDGTVVILRKPIYSVYDTYLPFPSNAMTSPRLGMPVYGLGLLECIPDEQILAYADPYDRDGDKISGRPNYAIEQKTGKTLLGRFGWKANTATLLDQCADAFTNDMGITHYLHPVDLSYGQPNGEKDNKKPVELSDYDLDAVVFYARTLAVPAPRGLDRKDVKEGARHFIDLGCSKCHVPSMKTGENKYCKALSNQTIYAYTDMLIHDMGEGLADNRPDFLANGNEWKTRPLWGIGLTETVNGYFNFLHDGRAKSYEEAILWHGGEAETVKEKYKALPKAERDKVIAFLKAL